MSFGEYLKQRREAVGLSQRKMAEKAGISNTEIWRIEAGERQNPAPTTLKVIAPVIGVTYEELLAKAGYIEKQIDHEGYTEHVYTDEDGRVIDIIRKLKALCNKKKNVEFFDLISQMDQMFTKDSEWYDLAYRISTELSENDKKTITTVAKALLNKDKLSNI